MPPPTSTTAPPTPSLPPAVITSPPTDTAALDARKKQLEIDKLEQEVATAREGRVWWRKSIRDVKLSEWVTAAAAIIALAAAFWTGLFNTIRERLSAQADRLAIEKIDLEQKKEKLGVEIAAREQELAVVKKRLVPFEDEAAAVQEMREAKKKLLGVRFSVTPENDGYKISVTSLDEKLDWSMLPKTRTNPNLTGLLKAVNRMRTLKGLKVNELAMTPTDAQLATQHDELETLSIDNAGVDQEVLTSLRPLPNCQVMVIRGNKITSFAGMPSYPSVMMLDASRNPFGDDALDSLIVAFPNLNMLNIGDTKVSDEGLKKLVRLRELNHINLRGTRATGQGALQLLDCPNLGSVDIDKDVVNDQQRAVMQKQRPHYSGFLHKQGEYRWGGDW